MGTACRPTEKIYVSTGRGGSICVIDTATQEVLSTIKTGARRWGSASPGRQTLYVAKGPSKDVAAIDSPQKREVALIKAGEDPGPLPSCPALKRETFTIA